MAISIACRLERTENILFNQNVIEYEKSTTQFTYSKSLHEHSNLGEPSNNDDYHRQLRNLQNNVEIQQVKYQLEI